MSGLINLSEKKKPRFFCNHCGYEVASDVRVCPYCGRNFVSVRCPACDYSGPDKMFQNGCPLCGYSTPPPPKNQKTPKIKTPRSGRRSSEPLPFWTYIITFIVILVLIALFSYFITR